MTTTRAQWEWHVAADQMPGASPCHSLIADGVLCRWWGKEEPPSANIIKAAPALLAALEKMCCPIDDTRCGNSIDARAAIAKARGDA